MVGLPYFKFFCSEWIQGEITNVRMSAQGLFINICSLYWFKDCNVSFDYLRTRIAFFDQSDFDILTDANLVKIIENDHISITFLDLEWAVRTKNKPIRKLNGSKHKPKNNRTSTELKPKNNRKISGLNRIEENRTEEIGNTTVGSSITKGIASNGTPLPFEGKGGLTPETAYEKLDKNAGLKGWNKEPITSFFKKIIGHEFQDDIFATIKSDREAWPEAFAQAHQTLYRLKQSAWQWDKSLFPELGNGDKPITYARLTDEQRMTVIEPKPETT